jgi:outer membrane protein assembly factor BamB
MLASVVGLLALSACGGEVPPSSFPGMTVDGQAVYLANNLHLYKYDAQSGVEVWRFPPANDTTTPARGPFAGLPLKYGNLIVVGGTSGSNGGYDNHLYAISEDTGAVAWQFGGGTLKEFADGVVSDGKIIYAPNGDGNLYALDPSQMENNEPKVLWKFSTGNRLWSRPLLADGKLYQGSFDHKLYAIDAGTGKELWSFSGATAPIAVQPALKDGVLYFGAFDSNFYAINAADGSVKWKTKVDGWVWTVATLNDDSAFFGDVQGKLYALDLASGQRQWFYETRDSIKAQPVLANDRLYVVSVDSNVYALDPTGAKKDASGKVDFNNSAWRNESLGRRMVSKPAVMTDTLLVPLFDGDVKVWALDANTGAKKNQFPPAAATPAPGK